MANPQFNLPPPPSAEKDLNDYVWRDWFTRLRNYIVDKGEILWSQINFTGSKITDIQSRSHQDLQSLQGGSSLLNQYYHLTSADYTDLTDGGNTTLHYHASDRDLANATGTLTVNHGGTGQTSYTDGQLLIGNSTGNTLSKNTLTAGTGISISNGGGSITITNTSPSSGGTVVGPVSSTDNAFVRFDGTTGQLIQNGLVTSDDAGNIANVNSVTFDTTPTTVPTTAGSLYWDSADGNQTLSLVMNGGNVIQQIGEEQYYRIKASSAITEGQVVMFTGSVGASGALTGAPATGLTAETASYIMGIATENIALNGWGYVTSFGLVRGIDTTGGAEAWTNGQILYYNPSVAGGLTKTVPTSPNAKIQVCAVVYASGGGAGSVFVRPTYGGKLGQFEGDVGITSVANGNILTYDGTNSKWTNTDLTAGTGISVTKSATGTLTVTNTSPSSGGTVTSVSGTGTVSGITLTGTVTTSGSLTLGGSLDLSSPPAIGNTTPNSGYFTTLNATSGIGGGTF